MAQKSDCYASADVFALKPAICVSVSSCGASADERSGWSGVAWGGQYPLSNGRKQNVIGTINLPQTAALQRKHPNESLRSPWPRSHAFLLVRGDAADIRHEHTGFPRDIGAD